MNTGLASADILWPKKVSGQEIDDLSKAAEMLMCAIQANTMPVIIGDYDADGITATAILYKLFAYYGITAETVIPRRFTDGYGISERIVSQYRNRLLICVDNGITADDAIRAARRNGNTVVILDHHLPSAELPDANVIVDPHVQPESNGFVDYCAAGICLKLAELMLESTVKLDLWRKASADELLLSLRVLACIGTLADVMPLTGDNRRIVKDGLSIINNDALFLYLHSGIRALLNLADTPYDEDTIKFKIGPILNAPGRLYNGGSTSSLKAVTETDMRQAVEYAGKMREINERRKALTAEWTAVAERKMHAIQDTAYAVVLHLLGIPEGLSGVVAGKIAKEYARPAIVLASSGGLLKGSARSVQGLDLSGLPGLLGPYCVSIGGHAGAAGLSLKPEQLPRLQDELEAFVRESGWTPEQPSLLYDMEIGEVDALRLLREQEQYAPYGEGVEKPVFLLKGFHAEVRHGQPYRFLGPDKSHLKLCGKNLEIIGFSLAEKYSSMGFPQKIDLIGTLMENRFQGNITCQFQAFDMKLPVK